MKKIIAAGIMAALISAGCVNNTAPTPGDQGKGEFAYTWGLGGYGGIFAMSCDSVRP